MDFFAPITITPRIEYFPGRTMKRVEQSLMMHGSMDHRGPANGLAGFTGPAYSNGNGVGFYRNSDPFLSKNGNGKKMRALHIEDDEEIRFLVKAFLKDYVDVDSAIDACDALSFTSEVRYDLIITDINLGSGIDGIETSREIRNMKYYQDVPIIAATANGTSEIRNQCIEVGMDAFLLKPFMKQDLIDTIKQVMEDRLH